MGFYAESIMGHMQINRLSSVLGIDIIIVYIKNMKIMYISMQALVHKNKCHIYTTTLISVTDDKLFVAIKNSVWARYGKHAIIRTNFFCTRSTLSTSVYMYLPIHDYSE